MVYVKKNEVYKDVNLLKSQKFVSFTKQVDKTHEDVVNGVLPAGSIYPKNDATAEGITINDVDVTNGAQPVGVIVEGHVLLKRLPKEPSEAAQKAMREIKFYDENGKMIALPA